MRNVYHNTCCQDGLFACSNHGWSTDEFPRLRMLIMTLGNLLVGVTSAPVAVCVILHRQHRCGDGPPPAWDALPWGTEDQDDTGHRWSAIYRFWSARIHVSLGFPLVGAPSAPMGITMWLARLGSGGPSTLALPRLSPCVACVRLRLATHHCTDCLTTTSPRIRSQPEDERACPGGADLLYQPNVSAAYFTFIT